MSDPSATTPFEEPDVPRPLGYTDEAYAAYVPVARRRARHRADYSKIPPAVDHDNIVFAAHIRAALDAWADTVHRSCTRRHRWMPGTKTAPRRRFVIEKVSLPYRRARAFWPVADVTFIGGASARLFYNGRRWRLRHTFLFYEFVPPRLALAEELSVGSVAVVYEPPPSAEIAPPCSRPVEALDEDWSNLLDEFLK